MGHQDLKVFMVILVCQEQVNHFQEDLDILDHQDYRDSREGKGYLDYLVCATAIYSMKIPFYILRLGLRLG